MMHWVYDQRSQSGRHWLISTKDINQSDTIFADASSFERATCCESGEIEYIESASSYNWGFRRVNGVAAYKHAASAHAMNQPTIDPKDYVTCMDIFHEVKV